MAPIRGRFAEEAGEYTELAEDLLRKVEATTRAHDDSAAVLLAQLRVLEHQLGADLDEETLAARLRGDGPGHRGATEWGALERWTREIGVTLQRRRAAMTS